MSSEIAISVRDISKHYLIFERPEDRLKQMLLPRLDRLVGRQRERRYYRDFAALNGVSFDVRRGETVGIIGRNGCGKSTLLQIICGTLQPTSGTVDVRGRVAALLELGAGFNPEFTGRENVYLNGAILGLAQSEIESRFDDIARFADIGMFLDQPVKTYSSGMYVRLAFATAINVDPDILVVDEALSVGDEAFQRKCFARIEDIKDKGGTILFVSHGAQTIVQLCDRAMLIDRGELILEGPPKTVVSQYQRYVNLSGAAAEPVREAIKAMDGWAGAQSPARSREIASAGERGAEDKRTNVDASMPPERKDDSWLDASLVAHSRVEYESRGALIRDVCIRRTDGGKVNVLHAGRTYVYEYTVDFEEDVENPGFGMMIKTVDGFGLGGAATDFSRLHKLPLAKAGSSYRVQFTCSWSLAPGTYFTNAGVTGTVRGSHAYSHRVLDALAFRIMPVEGSTVTGFIDFGAVPDVRPIDRNLDAGVDMPKRVPRV